MLELRATFLSSHTAWVYEATRYLYLQQQILATTYVTFRVVSSLVGQLSLGLKRVGRGVVVVVVGGVGG